MKNNRSFWGQHICLDLAGCPITLINNKDNILKWNAEIIPAIGMKAFGQPIIEHFATHLPTAAGFTLLQMIETSNIAAHFAENLGEAYIDIFSCKEFDENIVVSFCQDFFKPKTIVKKNMMRGKFLENVEYA